MGESSDAAAASLRSSVVSLTNGPSIMFGRPGCLPDPARASSPSYFARESRILAHDSHSDPCSVSTLGWHPVFRYLVALYLGDRVPGTPARNLLGTPRMSVSPVPHPGPRRGGLKRATAQANGALSWHDAESPLPGQVYVTAPGDVWMTSTCPEGATDAAPSLTLAVRTAFLRSHPSREKGV